MQPNIKATNMKITSDVHEYLDKKLSSLSRLIDVSDPTLKIDVELGMTTRHHQTGEIFRAEINLFKNGKVFRAVSEQGQIFAAIDDVRDELARELSTDKDKRMSRVRRAGEKIKNFLKGGN